LLFSLIIFGFVIYYFSEIRQEFRLLKKINFYWLLVAAIAQLGTYFFTALIYRILLKIFNVDKLPGIMQLSKVSVISLFFNQTIPSAGISGNTFLYNFLKKKNVPVPTIVSLILTELLSFYVVIEIIILLFLVLSFILKLPVAFHSVFIGGALVYLTFGVAVIFVSTKKSFNVLRQKLGKIKFVQKFFDRLSSDLDKMKTTDHRLRLSIFEKGKAKPILIVLLFQLLVFVTDAFTIFSLFYGLGIPVSFLFVALALIGSKIISILPFSPGALILYESSMTYFFVSLGIPLGSSLIVTLVYRLLSFWLPIPAGLILYRQWSNNK